MKLRTSSYEYYFRSKTHSHLLSSRKTAFRLAQLEERACAEWEAGMSLPMMMRSRGLRQSFITASMFPRVFLKNRPTHFPTIHGYI